MTIFILAVNKDLQKMGLTWEEAEVAPLDRRGWRPSVHVDARWIKVKLKDVI